MRRPDESITKNVKKLILERPYGLTIEEVSSLLGINRATASRHLTILELKGKIISRELGQSRLHYPRTRRFERWLHQ